MAIHINFKLYASLADYLPGDANNNSISVSIDESTSPYQLIDRYRVPRQQAHLVLLNGVYVKPEDRDKAVFQDGDTLAVWPPVAGG